MVKLLTMPSSRRSLTFGLLVCVTAVAFEGMAVVTAMPAAVADLGDQELYAWAFSALMIPQLFAIALAGRISDRSGPVKPLLAGLLLFGAGVVVAASAPTMPVLLVGRFIQGLGGGAINLCLMVVTARAFDPVERARIMIWYSACWMMPAFVGPGIAAWISEHMSWHWVFWLVLPVVVLGLGFMASGLRHLPDRSDAEPPGAPIPLHAAVAIAVGLTMLQAAGQRMEWLSLLLAGIGFALLAFNWGKLMPHGFSLLASGISAVVLVRLLTAGTFFGVESFLSLMLTARGAQPLQVGLVITVAAVGWMVGSWLQARAWLLLSRDQIIVTGALCVTAGTALVAVAGWVPAVDLAASLIGFIVCGLGMGLQSASTSIAVMQLSGEAELGRNTSSLQVGETVGNALLVGVAGTVYAALNAFAATQVTFGVQMTMLVGTAALGVVASLRIGFVENHSLIK